MPSENQLKPFFPSHSSRRHCMSRAIDFAIGAVAVFCILGIMGTLDLQAQQTAEAHKRETIAAAKREFARRQADDRYGALYREAERMTFPVAAYKREGQ